MEPAVGQEHGHVFFPVADEIPHRKARYGGGQGVLLQVYRLHFGPVGLVEREPAVPAVIDGQEPLRWREA